MAVLLTIRYLYGALILASTTALASCAEPPPTAAESLLVDQAMDRVAAEQARTDSVQRQRQATSVAELNKQVGENVSTDGSNQEIQRTVEARRLPVEIFVHPVAAPDPDMHSRPSS